LAASWRAAESELFTGLLQRPDIYQDVVALVRATLDRLRGLGPSPDALLDAADTVAGLVRELAEREGRATSGADPVTVGRAALAMRHREVVAHAAAAGRLARLVKARADPAADEPRWVVLEESGDRAGDPLAPYRRLEADPATGRALLVTAVPDADFRTVRHAVQAVHVDLDTGRVGPSPDLRDEPRACPDAAAREAEVAALRARLRAGRMDPCAHPGYVR
jgi:hypothetical protein